MIKVAVVGAKGRMGRSVVDTVESDSELELAVDAQGVGLLLDKGDNLSRIEPRRKGGSDVSTGNTDVVIEFSIPQTTFENVSTLVKLGVNVIVGTTGWTSEKIRALDELIDIHNADIPENEQVSVLIAPNFSLSAVLLEKFAKIAAPYFTSVEIIEMHHPNKLDAPSGTAISTAHAISDARENAKVDITGPDATISDEIGARGGQVAGIPVHAVRNLGLNAHEIVLMGNTGEQLEIRQDSFTRDCFMKGIVLAINELKRGHKGLTVGLEKLLEI
ncbi:MAG: 4-hydroxy-tetrahydrodipicolinate reductase [Candidatus Ancillula sp.]|jgi:4-hydroxy-tetrahydrodipicolinate reductase|nr:4-hydroxy-tetrahydrodipicolinate reductase [Candidatus Ancillula sp.]